MYQLVYSNVEVDADSESAINRDLTQSSDCVMDVRREIAQEKRSSAERGYTE